MHRDLFLPVRDEQFDGLVQLAAAVCGFGCAALNFVSESGDQLFVKSTTLENRNFMSTPLSTSLCRHTLLRKVDEAALELRVAENSGESCIEKTPFKCYAGAPIRDLTTGRNIGALCVFDLNQVRLSLSPQQSTFLLLLANQISNILELRRVNFLNDELVACIDGIPAKISHWDSQFATLLHANRSYCAQHGKLLSELKGKSQGEIMCPSKYEQHVPFTTTVLATGEMQKFETELAEQDGATIKFEYNQMVPEIVNGEVVGLFVYTTDITESKTLERGLIKSQEAERKANTAKSEFLASMSHELRTPLNGIIGMTALLLDMSDLNDLQRDYVQTINQSGQTLLTIINDILDFSKIEAGKMELESVEFDFVKMIHEVTKPFQYSAQKKGISFEVNIDGPTELHLVGDDGRISQVICNLIGNAIKFTYQGGVVVNVATEAKDTHTRIILKVTDTGMGIPPASRPFIFQSFTQAKNSKSSKFGGTGLGLFISRRLVEMMNGTIWFDSSLAQGEGTSFAFELTLKRGQTPKPCAEPVKVAFKKYYGRLLIAEDNITNQKVIERMLEKYGLRYLSVGNGLEAVKALESGDHFDLVLMDCQMPEMDGFEATGRIRASKATWSRIPIVAVTANAIQGENLKCLDAGMDDYITKPISLRSVEGILKKHLLSDDFLI